MASCGECSNEHLGSIECRSFLTNSGYCWIVVPAVHCFCHSHSVTLHF